MPAGEMMHYLNPCLCVDCNICNTMLDMVTAGLCLIDNHPAVTSHSLKMHDKPTPHLPHFHAWLQQHRLTFITKYVVWNCTCLFLSLSKVQLNPQITMAYHSHRDILLYNKLYSVQRYVFHQIYNAYKHCTHANKSH